MWFRPYKYITYLQGRNHIRTPGSRNREILQWYYFFRISIVSEAIISSSSVGITTTFT